MFGKFLVNHWKKLVLLVVVVAGIAVWRFWPKSVEYREYLVERGPLQVTLSVSGAIKAEKQADLVFQAGGRLAWVGIKKGDWVNQWQGIASLDQRTVQKNLEKELNDYLKTRWDFQGNRETYNVTTDDLDRYTLTPAVRRLLEKSQFDLNNAVLDVEIQTVAKEFSSLSSPFAGLVTDLKFPNPGINITAGAVIATIVDPDSLYFEAQVDEVDIARVRVGAPVKLVLDAYPEESIEAEVIEINFSPLSLSGGGTGYAVKIGLPPQTNNLKDKLGMNNDAEITVVKLEDVLILPQEAVSQKDGQWLVKVREGKQVGERKISIGWETEDKVEIVSGLEADDKVVINEIK